MTSLDLTYEAELWGLWSQQALEAGSESGAGIRSSDADLALWDGITSPAPL